MPVIATRGEADRRHVPIICCEFHARPPVRPRLTRSARDCVDRRRGVPLLAALVRLPVPDRLRSHATAGLPAAPRQLRSMSCCFRCSPCTTACWRGPARSAWSRSWRRRSWSDRSTPGSASLLFIAGVHRLAAGAGDAVCRCTASGAALGYVVQLAGLVLTIRSSAALDVLDLAGVRQVQRAQPATPPRHVALETTRTLRLRPASALFRLGPDGVRPRRT